MCGSQPALNDPRVTAALSHPCFPSIRTSATPSGTRDAPDHVYLHLQPEEDLKPRTGRLLSCSAPRSSRTGWWLVSVLISVQFQADSKVKPLYRRIQASVTSSRMCSFLMIAPNPLPCSCCICFVTDSLITDMTASVKIKCPLQYWWSISCQVKQPPSPSESSKSYWKRH